ncbi:ABC transporter ATP-binding protein [Paenibacillus gallinarum]|uniref:ABC transporter ATP-binding protein n=1 Tax=Paenibacillus gallinarum TaxID=2762232 RepID=A0ABR8SXP5_9BACL|nr:ABC transporter ATP-binding protein [Paenibacillus gallinarum]
MRNQQQIDVNEKPNSVEPSFGPPSMGSTEKANDFQKTIKKLVVYSKGFTPFIVIALILAIISTAFTVYGPDLLSQLTDTIQKGLFTSIDLEAVQKIGLLLCVFYGLSFLFSYVQGFIMATVTQRITKKMRSDLAVKMNRLSLKYYDQTSIGNILSRVTNDVDTIGQTLNNSFGQLVTSIVTFVGVLCMMFYTNWIMAITGILSSLIGFGLMAFIMKNSQKYFDGQQKQLGELNGHIEEIYTGHQIVKAYNGENKAKEKFHGVNDELFHNAWMSQFLSGLMMPIMQFIGNFGYVAICVVGAILVTNGSITIGIIVAFMIYVRLFTQPLAQIAQAVTSLQSTAAASERVFEFLEQNELEDESDKNLNLPAIKGNVSFEHVSFGYDENTIIHDFSLDVKAGQKIAIVGPTGAGKTTLVNLLMRFYEVNKGTIKIDGISIQEMTREQVHDQFCMVLQDTWLFEGSIRDNIAYAKQNVSQEEIETAAKAVGIHHMIQTMPKGYDTVLDEKITLSVGQKQLITIARAIVANAPLLILDEATSSVDTRTEMLIQQAMDTLMKGKTSFVIAHRLSTIKNADIILVMKDGTILETGTHEQLLERNGFYANLYNSQFEMV